jgi:hypothetical protein
VRGECDVQRLHGLLIHYFICPFAAISANCRRPLADNVTKTLFRFSLLISGSEGTHKTGAFLRCPAQSSHQNYLDLASLIMQASKWWRWCRYVAVRVHPECCGRLRTQGHAKLPLYRAPIRACDQLRGRHHALRRYPDLLPCEPHRSIRSRRLRFQKAAATRADAVSVLLRSRLVVQRIAEWHAT